MSLRAQTVRRLAVLLLAVLVLVGAGVALYARNEHQKNAKMAEARAAGMKAFEAGDYRAALESLKYYVAKEAGKQDIEALYAYGVSRARLEEPNGKHVGEGITAFNAVLQLDPGHTDAKHRLLELYPKAYRNQEAIDLADRVLESTPDDADALKAKVIAHERNRETEKALAASQKLNELNPTDLDQQLITYELMRKLKSPPQAMLARAQKQQQAHPKDPRFQMLLAMAYGNAGDLDQGKQWLAKAAEQPAPDATFVRHMVRVYDSLKMYPESEALLKRVTAQSKDPLIFRVLAQRLWQNGQNGQVIKLLADLDSASDKSDTGLLAYKALALFETGKKEDARDIVTKLAARKDDTEAIAWSTALGVRFTPTAPKDQLAQYQAALVRSPDNPIIRFLVGESYSRLGETELAISAWRRAADLSPSWATPHVDIARTLAANGRIKEALAEAQAAVRAAPTQIVAAVTLATIRHRAIQEMGGDAPEEARLLALVEQIQKMSPGEPETLPLHVHLLAKANRRDDAIAVARNALKLPKRPSQSTLLRLTAVSRENNLGLEEELKPAADAAPDSPRLALARAADLAANGKPLDGLALLEDNLKGATTQPVQWQLALAQYKELIRDPEVRGEWIKLGDSNPKDLSVQTTILNRANSTRNDRDFIARTIDRVKQLTGPEGQTWKIERARWLLAGATGKDGGKDAAEAVNTLTDIVRTSPTHTEARLLLASAFEKVNNIPGAIKELQAAAELEPNSAAVAIEVARLMQSQNKFADARTYLERAAGTPDLTADSRRRIAQMLAAQSDYARAIKILRDAGDNLDAPGKVLLADIYRREGKLAEAEAVYKQLLAQPSLDADAVRGAADFYAATGRVDEAKKVIQRLGETGARPGQAELIQASFAERHVGPEAARNFFIAATKAAPADPTYWRHLVAFHLRGARYAEAEIAADEALKSIGRDDAALRRLQAASHALAALSAQKPAVRPMLAVLAAAAPEDRGASEFLSQALAAGGGAGGASATQPSDEALLARLKNIAGVYPRSMPLQAALVQWFVARREFSEAGQAATRMMEAFPNDPDPARVAASVYRAAGQPDVAVSAINKWRERSPENALQADAMIAEIRLSQGDAATAARVLQPHAAALIKDPSQNPAALAALLRAYAQSNREREARQILEPTLLKDRASRALWLQVASNDIKDTNTAIQWVRHVAPMIPPDALGERTALGNAWYTLSVRAARDGKVEGATEEAIKVLDPIVQRPDAPVDAVLLRAALSDRAGDQKASEDLYRRGLKIKPDQPDALNNLAYLILLRDGDMNEAKQMITRAVQLSPGNASFHDTLGRVQSKMGERDAAIASFKRAIDIEPNNLEALIGLATAFTDAGKRDAAAALLPQIDTLLKTRPALPVPVRRELDALRATMKASL